MNFNEFKEAAIKEMTLSTKEVKSSIKKIRQQVKSYVKNNNIKSLVVGVSGGLDSAVICALLQEKYTGVPLLGMSIPLSSSENHKEKARWVGEQYCTKFQEMDAWDNDNHDTGMTVYDQVFYAVSTTDRIATKAGFRNFDEGILQGNIKARLRMISLYDLARKTRGIVVSTDNYSELWLGFWTLHGDVGDLSPIQYIEKGIEEPQFARELKIREDIITQKPSDGLNVISENDSDEDHIGMSYQDLGPVIYGYEKRLSPALNKAFSKIKDERIDEVIKRHKGTQFKRNGVVELKRSEIGLRG